MQHAPQDPGSSSSSSGLRFEGRPVDLDRQNEYDALADLFLGDDPADLSSFSSKPTRDDDGGGPAPPTSSKPMIEGLVLGHLPVRGGAWTGQYAEAIAGSTGAPVALLRVGGGQASIDLYGSTSPASHFEPTSLATALINARGIASHWVIHSDELGEGDLAELGELDQVTLLAGGNEASIVATYRAIKGMSHGARDGDARSIALAIVGATTEQAGAIRDRIERASRLFLEQPVALAAVIDRVGPTSGQTLFDGAADQSLAAIVHELRARLSAAFPTSGLAAARDQAQPPEPVINREVCRQATSRPLSRDSLAAHVDELITLQAKCPDDPETELAVDPAGRIHLLREDSAGFERLTVTQAWARKHAPLLALTTPDSVAIDPGHEPIVHLFSPEPKRVRHLLDTGVRIHLRARVVTDEGQSAWFTTELN